MLAADALGLALHKAGSPMITSESLNVGGSSFDRLRSLVETPPFCKLRGTHPESWDDVLGMLYTSEHRHRG
jgi:hypothetical protein